MYQFNGDEEEDDWGDEGEEGTGGMRFTDWMTLFLLGEIVLWFVIVSLLTVFRKG